MWNCDVFRKKNDDQLKSIEIWIHHKHKYWMNVNFFFLVALSKKKQQQQQHLIASSSIREWSHHVSLGKKKLKIICPSSQSVSHSVKQGCYLVIIIIIISYIIITNKWLIWTAPAIYLPPPMVSARSLSIYLVMRQDTMILFKIIFFSFLLSTKKEKKR